MKIILAAALMATAPTALEARDSADGYAAAAIARSDYATAEKRLKKQLARRAGDQVALVNLAQVYRRTGRMAEAETIYRRLLSLENVALAMPDGNPVWSHRIASVALERLPVRVSALESR